VKSYLAMDTESNDLVEDSIGSYSTDKESIVYNKAYQFAIRVVKVYQYMNKEKIEAILLKQFLRSGTSIGANVAEANGAISRNDFSAKMSIAYKECLETKYWLSLLKDTKLMEERVYQSMFADADEIGKMLFAIIKTSRINKSK
jgi:four helix bundle protein